MAVGISSRSARSNQRERKRYGEIARDNWMDAIGNFCLTSRQLEDTCETLQTRDQRHRINAQINYRYGHHAQHCIRAHRNNRGGGIIFQTVGCGLQHRVDEAQIIIESNGTADDEHGKQKP